MKRIHFVYSTPLTLKNILDKISMKFFNRLVCHILPGRFIYPKPLCSPFSISKLLIDGLSKKYELRYYDLRERAKISPRVGDLLLGHMWMDPKSIMWPSMKDSRFSKKIIISPFNHDARQIEWFKGAVDACDLYFAISGDHWFKNLESSIFKDFSFKMVQLNMFVDRKSYPRVKKKFGEPGKRTFFYIGRYGAFGDEKGIGILEELAKQVEGFQGGYICSGGEIAGWSKISEPRSLDVAFMSKLAEKYDFFINLSRHDAQATTILEAMSWGFPVLCTPESGYGDDHCMGQMSLHNMDHNLEMIEKYQYMKEDELMNIVNEGFEALEKKYSPEIFMHKVFEGISRLQNGKAL